MTNPAASKLAIRMPHILNVDEDRDSSAITTAVLTAAGFEVISASDGRSAIDTLASRAIDIIVLGDVSDLEPLEVCDRIKMSQATCDIPVVLLTAAHLTAADLTRALAAGVDQYLVQPVESEALIAILCGLFLRRLAQLEIRAAADRGETRLPRSEARYRSLITDAAIGIYQSTPDGRFRIVNPALVTMLVYDSVEELLNMPLTDIYANPDDRQRVLREFKGKTSARLEVPWKRKNGKLITVRLSGRVATAQERGTDDVDKLEIFVAAAQRRRDLKHQLREMQKMEALGRLGG